MVIWLAWLTDTFRCFDVLFAHSLPCAVQVANAISTALSAEAVTVERQDFSKLANCGTTGVFSSEPEVLYIVRFAGRNGGSPPLTVTFTGTPSSDLQQSVTLYNDGSGAVGAVTTGYG
jgi:hypothetical protein